MNHNDMYSMKNLIFWRGVSPECTPRASQLIFRPLSGNMDEEHREWFCQRYELYCRQVSSQAEAAH
ncbi:glycogen synthesis protein GlgS [Klebsiella pneumoniae]|nr:glycogen synthesis protein GlgS [Klebsiella pneumoniae]